jgi:hypothetical protein
LIVRLLRFVHFCVIALFIRLSFYQQFINLFLSTTAHDFPPFLSHRFFLRRSSVAFGVGGGGGSDTIVVYCATRRSAPLRIAYAAARLGVVRIVFFSYDSCACVYFIAY